MTIESGSRRVTDEIRFIDTAEALAAFCGEIAGAGWIALDTEFVREKTYYPRLCLVQVATPDALACIDPIALPDLGPLAALLHDPAVTKVVHAAHQDMEILLQSTGRVPTPVFDTQVAVSLLGHGDQIGYARMVQIYLDLELDKGHTRTDWSQRPLETAQLRYAADDVRHLARVYPMILKDLEEKGRLDWLSEDFAAISEESRYLPDPDNAWRRIKGQKYLKGAQLAVLQALAAWRERQAMEKNLPKRWILSDDVLTELSQRSPTDLASLAKVRGLEEKTLQRHGETLLALVREARSLPASAWPTRPGPSRGIGPEHEELIDVAMGLLRHQARINNISPAAIATRKDLEALFREEPGCALLQGWRARIAGRVILDWYLGRLRLQVRDERMALDRDGS
ncbi:ribonuclease D [Thioalkalivibrio sulfidiphilus]|uniref:ribonuclease D n=1 Tax=Thioalkalivibrio sulfidiphilus TaxID=1033854 RepID=UPI0004759E85|nr:ribonuclease D [Thioalkalivibrio sulfidiphilus]